MSTYLRSDNIKSMLHKIAASVDSGAVQILLQSLGIFNVCNRMKGTLMLQV